VESPENRKEEKLLDELESMYQRVAASEKSEADSVQKEALQSYYELTTATRSCTDFTVTTSCTSVL